MALGHHRGFGLAKTILGFQCLERTQADREAAYMHRNPVKRGLVEQPEHWKWSSFRAYFYGEPGPVRVNFQEWPLQIKNRPLNKFGDRRGLNHPLIRKRRE